MRLAWGTGGGLGPQSGCQTGHTHTHVHTHTHTHTRPLHILELPHNMAAPGQPYTVAQGSELRVQVFQQARRKV